MSTLRSFLTTVTRFLKNNVFAPFTPQWWKSRVLSKIPFIGRGAKKQALPDTDAQTAPVAPQAPTVVRQYEEHPSTAYMELKYNFRDVGRMQAISETLGRDFLTAMPEGAWKSRLGQIAFLHRRIHEDITSTRMSDLIERAKSHQSNHPDDWDEWDTANLREMDTMHSHYKPVSPDLIEKRARMSYEGRRQHRDCLSAGDWPAAREYLTRVIDLNKQIAEAKCQACNTNSPYEALMDEYMPGIKLSDVESWFGTMEKRLSTLLPEILERQKQTEPPKDMHDFYPAKAQMWLNQAMLSAIGFDFQRGGLYETGHNPVEGGTPEDTRLVIKNVDIHNFMDSLKSALHEGGHGIYIQGLPRTTWRYQPVAQDMGAAVHESQALIIEMIMARTRAFYSYISPRVEGLFHGLQNPTLSADNMHKNKIWVQPTTQRKSADEVTYFLHILHRFKLERDLINGKLKVADLPEAWNAGMRDLLGIEPDSVKDGCLQDVHWFVGKFGYFPSYAIGHMLAAQLYQTMRKDEGSDLFEHIAQGNFMPVTSWMREKIHKKGRLLQFDDLVTEATGKKLSPKPLIAHLESRYLKDNALITA